MAAGKERTVVIAMDASEFSEYALQFYLDWIHLRDNKVILVACPEYHMSPSDYEMSAARVEQEILGVKAQMEAMKKKYLTKLADKGINAEFDVVETNKPGHAVCELAKEKGATLIITGNRGLGKLRRTILGSVSDYIVHHSEIPVLVCRHTS